jgi:PAS domain S-box-containing protein
MPLAALGRNWSWATKLSLLLVALAVLPVSVMAIYDMVVTRTRLVEATWAQDLQRARATGDAVDRHLADIVAQIRVAANSPTTERFLELRADPTTAQRPAPGTSLADVGRVLAQIRVGHNLEELYVIDLEGRVATASGRRVQDRSFLDDELIRAALAGEVTLGDPKLDLIGQVFFEGAAPVRAEGIGIVGAVVGRSSMAAIDRIVAGDTNFAGRADFGVLWDEHGIRLSEPTAPANRFRPISPLPPAVREQLVQQQRFGPATAERLEVADEHALVVSEGRRLLAGQAADLTLHLEGHPEMAGSAHYVTMVPLKTKRWLYGIFTPEPGILAALYEQQQRTVVVAILTGLFALLLAIAAARRFARPMELVGETARAIAAGDLTRRVHLDRLDEVGQLGAAFDAMADEVARKDLELRQNAERLELEVQARTAELRASEAELRAVIETVPDLIFRVRRDGTVLALMSLPHDSMAAPRESVVGRHVGGTLPPDVTALAMRALERTIDTREPQMIEYALTVRGAHRDFEARLMRLAEDEALAIIRDITARKQAERERSSLLQQIERERIRVATLVGNVPGVVWEAWGEPDAEHQRIDFVSDYVETMLGYSVPEWLSTPNFWLTIVHPDDRERAAAEAVEFFTGGTGGVSQFRWMTRDGRAIWVEAQSLVLHDEAGRPVGMCGVTMDITSRKQAEEERRQLLAREQEARRRAEEANRLKDEFVSTVSHELRTPLNAILGWGRLLSSGKLDAATATKAMASVERNARAQAQIVDDLLDISRIITGKLRLDDRELDLARIVESAIDGVRPAAEGKAIQIALARPDDATMVGDPDRLQQVVWNLLSNAVKFTPAGGRVDVAIENEGEALTLVVRDSGIGIRSEFLPYVFERFSQADGTATRAFGGLGLGLAIARHLVELHGGTIEAFSEGENRGATFRVRLPVRATGAARFVDEPETALADPHAQPLAGLRVLVVDDEAETRDLLHTILASSGASVDLAASAHEAFERLRSAPPDVIVRGRLLAAEPHSQHAAQAGVRGARGRADRVRGGRHQAAGARSGLRPLSGQADRSSRPRIGRARRRRAARPNPIESVPGRDRRHTRGPAHFASRRVLIDGGRAKVDSSTSSNRTSRSVIVISCPVPATRCTLTVGSSSPSNLRYSRMVVVTVTGPIGVSCSPSMPASSPVEAS